MVCLEALVFAEFFQEKSAPWKQAEVLKGNFNDNLENFDMTSKREVPCVWTGMNEDDFGFFLNGFQFVAGHAFISNFYMFRVFSSWQRWFSNH